MGRSFAALTIPLFLGLIGLEAMVGRLRRRPLYRLQDALTSLSCGALEQLVGLFFTGGLFWVYAFAHRHLGLVPLRADSPWTWALGLLGTDLLLYAWHRASHRVALLWAVHSVHHQSEDYNLAVGLRHSAFHRLTVLPFLLPLAVLGVPVEVLAGALAVSVVYQFLLHTELLGRLPLLGAVLNTPGHHRLHHGFNLAYRDHNLGAVLIVWDRLLGTFAAEEEGEEPVYGLERPLASWNALKAQGQALLELLELSRRAPSLGQGLAVCLRPPGWHPRWLGPRLVPDPPSRARFRKYDPPAGRGVRGYVVLAFLPVLGAAWAAASLGLPPTQAWLWATTALVALSCATLAALLEGRWWARGLELMRLTCLGTCAALALSGRPLWGAWAAGAAGLCVGLGGWVLYLTRATPPVALPVEPPAPRRVV